MNAESFELQKAGEKALYATENTRRRPAPIFGYWNAKFLLPRVEAVFGVRDPRTLYADAFCRVAERPLRLLSIGSGTARLEILIARILTERGIPFEFDCIDLSPDRPAQASKAILEAGLTPRNFRFIEADANDWVADQSYTGIMANHSLHHIVGLEHLFDQVYKSLTPNGVFVSIDMIGRNGHMRWPEALTEVEKFWQELPETHRLNLATGNVDDIYYNRDFSDNSFEGVRAQDILPLLVERFNFSHFFAHGGIADAFVEKVYGFNFDRSTHWDCDFVDRVTQRNETLIDNGTIKPTMMWAVMTKQQITPVHFRHWSPEWCVRPYIKSAPFEAMPMNVIEVTSEPVEIEKPEPFKITKKPDIVKRKKKKPARKKR